MATAIKEVTVVLELTEHEAQVVRDVMGFVANREDENMSFDDYVGAGDAEEARGVADEVFGEMVELGLDTEY